MLNKHTHEFSAFYKNVSETIGENATTYAAFAANGDICIVSENITAKVNLTNMLKKYSGEDLSYY